MSTPRDGLEDPHSVPSAYPLARLSLPPFTILETPDFHWTVTLTAPLPSSVFHGPFFFLEPSALAAASSLL